MKFFTAPALLAAALVSVAVAALGLLRSDPPTAPFALEARLASTAAGRVQLYYDRGAGFSEADSSQLPLLRSDAPLPYRLLLPPGRYSALRFDPIDGAGTVIVDGPLRVVARSGRVIRTFALSRLHSANQIQSLRERDGRIEVVVERGANDPQLAINFPPPLDLRPPSATSAGGFSLRALGVFAVLAALLFALSRATLPPGKTPWRDLIRFAARPPLWLTLAACAGVLAARRPDVFLNPQFWAEDSVIFYQQAYTLGASALVEPYASYHLAVPRLTAAASMWLDPLWAPAFFVAMAFTGTLYVAARTQSTRCPLPPHAGCALAVVLVPDAYEVLLNVGNLQWLLAGGLVLLLISADAGRWWQSLHDGVVAVLFGLTGPFSILVFGLFVWRAWSRRTGASMVLAAVMTACAATQAWTIWRNPVVMAGDHIAPEALLAVPGMRITASLLAGSLVPLDYPRAVETFLGVVGLLGVAALAVRKGPTRPERIWLALAFAGLLASSLYRCRYVLPELCNAGYGSRYFYPLSMIVGWLLLAAAKDERRWLARTVTVAVLWSLAINIPRLRENAFADLHWSDYAPNLRAGEAVEVPVNPEPWVMKLPAKKP